MDGPADPNQRKADLLSCPRWVISSLQNERVARRELEQKLQALNENGNSDLLSRENQILRAQIEEFEAQQERQKIQNDSVKKFMMSKEAEFQQLIQENQALQEKYDNLEQSTLEKASKWREIASILPQRNMEIENLQIEVENLKKQLNNQSLDNLNLEDNLKKEKVDYQKNFKK